MSNRVGIDEYRKMAVKTKKKKVETGIQDDIRTFLTHLGWFVTRHQQGLGSMKGIPDLSAIKNGITIYIEVKTPNPRSKMSDDQLWYERNIIEHGGLFCVPRSLDDVNDFLIKNKLR